MAGRSLGRRVAAIPASDVDALRPAWLRTTAVRLVLGAALLLTAVGAVAAARTLEPAKASFLPTGTSGIVVLDVSLSVTDPTYRRIHNALRMLSRQHDQVGVILFSDIAYEMLPPGSPAAEVEPMARFFRPRPSADQTTGYTLYPLNPWLAGFSAGTKISAGLDAALEALEREGIENGSVLLVSDLDTAPSDEPNLSASLTTFLEQGVPLRVVPLFPTQEDRAFFVELLGEDALITPPQLAAQQTRRADASLLAANPALLALLGGLMLILLSANEWWGARVELVRRPA